MIRYLIAAMLAAVVVLPAHAQPQKNAEPGLVELARQQQQQYRKPEPRKPTAAERQKFRADMAKRQQARPASPGLHTRTQAIGTTAPANAITAQARRTTATPGQPGPVPQNRMPASRPMPQNRSQLPHMVGK